MFYYIQIFLFVSYYTFCLSCVWICIDPKENIFNKVIIFNKVSLINLINKFFEVRNIEIFYLNFFYIIKERML